MSPSEELWSSFIGACRIGDGLFVNGASGALLVADISALKLMPCTVRP